MLTLEIEFLTGVCYAARSQSSEQPDWPPQPDRVFSALVAAWGVRGECDDERKALEWLEGQSVPTIERSAADARRVGISYVPPNDAGNMDALPERRRRQARTFPAAIPEVPIMRMRWDAEVPEEVYGGLAALAQDTTYVGHSASLVRCRFVREAVVVEGLEEVTAKRQIYSGRLSMLIEEYKAGRRPSAGEPVLVTEGPKETEISGVFGSNWMIFEDQGGWTPDLRATAVVMDQFRKSLMSLMGRDASLPEWVSGHAGDGGKATEPHMAVLPMADVGWEHSEGRPMGLAIVLPRKLEQERRAARLAWLAGEPGSAVTAARWRVFEEAAPGVTNLKLGNLGQWEIAQVTASTKKSLQPQRYLRASKRWASATPVVLDRYPKKKDSSEREIEIESILAESCVNIGLPKPTLVRAGKHSAITGAPPSYPSGKSPDWMGWRLTGSLANRLLTHVVIEFEEPVRGPVLLGAGRFCGLGLCLPFGDRR